MTLIYSVILCLLFMASSCQLLQCVKETPKDTEFSINVTTHIKAEAGDCIGIKYQFTFPANKVMVPYKKIWFQGEPQNIVTVRVIDNLTSGTIDTFTINGLPRGEYEYGFILEWQCNQTYIFPKRVRVSVSALTKRPTVWGRPMTEGQYDTLFCRAQRLCFETPEVYWDWTTADGSTLRHDHFHRPLETPVLQIIPKADDHNTNITCVVKYGDDVVKTTFTLTVKFAPKILNGSQCRVEGKLLVCVCISRGNPLAPITWPLASLVDFSVTSFSSMQTVNSTIRMPAADYHNASVKCISSNTLGQAKLEIPLQNYMENLNDWSDGRQKFDAALPWTIAGVSLGLNLVLLSSLIICTYKRGKHTQEDRHEEMNTYTSLNRANVGQDYSVISPQPR